MHARIFTSMRHAHVMNIEIPGSYEEQLNKTLRANNLPTLKIPTIPKSEKIITKCFKPGNQKKEKSTQKKQQTHKKKTEVEVANQEATPEQVKTADIG